VAYSLPLIDVDYVDDGWRDEEDELGEEVGGDVEWVDKFVGEQKGE
jgi:hypothetical protein